MPLSYFLAERYREAGKPEKAEPIYVKLLEEHKTRPPIEAFQNLVDIYRQQKNADKVLATLGEAVTRVNTLEPLGTSGKDLVADTELTRQILSAADKQLAADPNQLGFGPRLAAGLLAVELKDFATANKYFDLAVQANKEKAPDVLLTWGLEMFVNEQYADAIRVFQRGLDEKVLEGKDPRLHFYLAGALEMNGETDRAIEVAKKIGEGGNDAVRFAGRVPWIQYHAKRYEDARKSYQELIDKYGESQEPAEVRDVLRDTRLALSNLCVVENKLDESEEWIEQVLDEFPEDTSALNDLGYLWADRGKHLERALKMVQTAVAEEPKNMAYRDSLGWALFRLGRYEEAVAELKVAASAEEPDGVILDHLADALLKAGQTPAALEEWNRAAKFFDEHKEPAKAQAVREKIAKAQNPPAEK
jgi:tetratricopeptide (TPR) repeat protein